MNRIVAVPNWSFYDRRLERLAVEELSNAHVTVHYCQGDVDHQRSVIAYSGDESNVLAATTRLAHVLLPNINLAVHEGAHPRVGALDVLPFVLLE